jgi:transposase
MKKAPPTKEPRYEATFRAKALRLASESRSTLAAARALNIDPKRLYAQQKAAPQPLPAAPTEAIEVRTLRAANKRLAQELKILKKPPLSFLHCQVLGVVPSRYYAWRKGVAVGAVAHAEPAWETVLADAFDDHQRRYGHPSPTGRVARDGASGGAASHSHGAASPGSQIIEYQRLYAMH